MLSTRFFILFILSAFFLNSEKSLVAQCATGAITLSGYSFSGGSGTYSDPATGNISIHYCFSLEKFKELSTNWVHGLFISWENLPKAAIVCEGPTGSQQTQQGNRFWTFFDSAKAKSLNLPGPGFYVDDGDFNPKNNYGDNGLGSPNAIYPDLAPFCFTIKLNCGASIPTAFVPKVTITGDGATGAWTNSSCTGDVIRSTNSGPNKNGAIVLCGVVLPVKLLEFIGEASNHGNTLIWKASADNLFSHFELEVSKGFNNQFSTLAIIEPDKNAGSNEIRNYSFLDIQPVAVSFYRLKMIEKDGSFVYSKIISIKQRSEITAGNRFSIFPNPAVDFLILHNNSKDNFGDFEINIYDLFGRKINTSIFNSNSAEQDFYIEISNYSKGMYFLEISSGNQTTEKFNFLKQ